MIRRLLIPAEDSSGTRVSNHFGRAPFFALIDIEDGTVVARSVEPNTGEHSGGSGHAHDNVLRYNPHVVIVSAMGPRGLDSFQTVNVAVLRASSDSVDENIDAYLNGELDELTEGCLEAHQ
ncbi:MAG: NifB/NifX family molybdenum-iron cluster-binding protein [Candidatus Thorarchaeota archaeon]|nr:NifB/NifX family molybdenum-iron cluster-binding protein [Candidatus Thorarchaeota archaeon]